MNEMLLRGCMLKNSHYVAGLVVYTGKETRIQMNAAKTPLKVGECVQKGWQCVAKGEAVGNGCSWEGQDRRSRYH